MVQAWFGRRSWSSYSARVLPEHLVSEGTLLRAGRGWQSWFPECLKINWISLAIFGLLLKFLALQVFVTWDLCV